jgi:hypothetical protein
VGSREYSDEPLDSLKSGKFLDYLVTVGFSRILLCGVSQLVSQSDVAITL